ncbi:DUF664 domain-containing protein [Nocardioides sp. NPDC051685]|uniref:mycothiol transferase n=1 Tax=Nocardioides sp. NPDC051685 TaxID=3364334 RepID=UPI0037A76783
MIDDFAKAHLHDKLRGVREVLAWKLEGLPEDDIRRPLTPTGTNLLGLVKHNALSDARYFGEVFDRTPPIDLPPWDTDGWWAAATRHAGHADILRETIDGSVGVNPETA